MTYGAHYKPLYETQTKDYKSNAGAAFGGALVGAALGILGLGLIAAAVNKSDSHKSAALENLVN